MAKIDNDEDLKKFVNALVPLCQEFNLALQNGKVWRQAVAHVTPGSGLPRDLTRSHPEFVKRLIKLCQEYSVQLSAEHFTCPHQEGMDWVSLVFRAG